MDRRFKIRCALYIILLLCGVAYAANFHILGDNKKLYFYDTDSGTDYTITFRAGELTISTDYVLPLVDATVGGQALQSDASGVLSFGDIILGTNTTGDYVKDVADGMGIDGTATGEGSTYTPTFDSTELDALTWSDGTNASNIWTFDVSGTDHTMTVGSALITFSNIVDANTFNALDEINALQIDGTTQFATKSPADVDGVDNLFIGANAGESNTEGELLLFIGKGAGKENTTGDVNIFIGFEAGLKQTTAAGNILIGRQAGAGRSSSPSGNFNVALGSQSLGWNVLSSGEKNFCLGALSGKAITSGSENILIGYSSGSNLTTQSENVLIGADAGNLGTHNVFIGRSVGPQCTSDRNTAIGYKTCSGQTSGQRNTVFGWNASFFNQSGSSNAIVGYGAFRGASGNSHSSNTGIGYEAGNSITTGSNNVFLGRDAGYYQTTLGNRLIIDNQTRTNAATEITNCLIYGIFDATPASQSLRINAEILGSDGAKVGDVSTNNLIVTTTGDTYWTGTAGLIFGHMDVPAANVITVETSGTANPVEVRDDGTASANDGWETGELNGTTFAVSDLHYITVTIAGKYKVIWSLSPKTNSGGGTVIHGGITIDTTTFVRDNGEGHAHVFNANDDIHIGGVGVIDCPNGNEEISLWISNDAAQKAVIEHGNMYIEQIAGT